MKGGHVYIAGAGPGDIRLITLRAMELIQEADVIVYDRLGAQSFLEFAKKDCEKLDAGKEPTLHRMKQGEINKTLVQKAKEGKKVLRLKGGDPFVFGRGAEEAEALDEAGIPYEIIPGVSSFYSACAYGGIPITHREMASSFHVFTGHRQQEKEIDYQTIAKTEGTLIFLMSMKNLDSICQQLIAYGKDANTPAAVVQWGTLSKQKQVYGTLKTIAASAQKENIGHPAIVVIGEVAAENAKLQWQKYRPLWGKKILLTGTKNTAQPARAFLMEEGAEVTVCPMITLTQKKQENFKKELEKLKEYTWLFFTSAKTVEVFFQNMKENRMDIRCLQGVKMFCIGEKTKEALESYGIFPDRIPKQFYSDCAAQEMEEFLTVKDKVLFPCSELADTILEEKAKELGVSFTRVEAYGNEKNQDIEPFLLQEVQKGGYDAIGFYSASQVNQFWQWCQGKAGKAKWCSLGPATSKAIRQLGEEVAIEAKQFTSIGLAQAMLQFLQ